MDRMSDSAPLFALIIVVGAIILIAVLAWGIWGLLF